MVTHCRDKRAGMETMDTPRLKRRVTTKPKDSRWSWAGMVGFLVREETAECRFSFKQISRYF